MQPATFADEFGRVFNTLNTPLRITVPAIEKLQPIELKGLQRYALLSNTMDYADMRRIQYATNQVPEAAFLLKSRYPHDSLLSYLSIDLQNPPLVRYTTGWGLNADTYKTWTALEKVLAFVSQNLLDYGNLSTVKLVNKFPFWAYPSDMGFNRQHRTYSAAANAVRRAYTAFMFLAARCSLSIALWEHAAGKHDDGRWATFLALNKVPEYWIDKLQQSMISKLEPGIRVGTAIDYDICDWVDLIDVFKFSNVPILVEYTEPLPATIGRMHPDLLAIYPTQAQAEEARAFAPLINCDTRYQLVSGNVLRVVPDPRNWIEYAPFGPYQHPGETREDFIARLRIKEVRIASTQTAEASH